MNRKPLVSAILAGLSGSEGMAGAAIVTSLKADGLGQVLLYPYYRERVQVTKSYTALEVLAFNEYCERFGTEIVQHTRTSVL